MSGFRLIDLAKPFVPLLPEIEKPYSALSFDDKVVYTIAAGIIYILAQLPVYGTSSITNDPIYWIRPIFGAEKGTLLEFGAFPIISSGLIFQLLASLRVIKVNFQSRTDRELFQTSQKIFSIFQYFLLTNLFLLTGYFGYNLSFYQIIAINLQLVGAGFVFTLISEIIDKGYGFGSGALTFTTVNIAANFVGDFVGISSVHTTRGWERQGALINLISNIRTKPFTNAIVDSFTRSYLPNLTQFYAVAATILGAVYLQNFRIDLPIRSNKVRSVSNVFPIKLLYTGALPLLFSYVVLFYINIVGYAIVNGIFKNDPTHIAVKILGHYVTGGFSGNFVVENFSLLYLFSPSSGLFASLLSPIKTIVFFGTIALSSALFANTWSVNSGSGPKDIAAQFKDQGVSISGRRDVSVSKELARVIPVAAVSGGLALAVLAEAGEVFGANGKAAAAVVAVGSAFSFLEEIASDFQQSGGSQNFGQFFGGAQ
ncbi:hypothetical protein WICMUC_000625 [Wickerhamomyces mucosus]|uniref:Translocon Sec61/SecY plug domain-containing protein n=1 Tax=Wickerhamomyces mucosus TaxID=1378264 RepID=A0A9P8PXA9_9ASCO|nr:hypothetical protein WICMUC_000625 [Wickerhamomyces mucosus]